MENEKFYGIKVGQHKKINGSIKKTVLITVVIEYTEKTVNKLRPVTGELSVESVKELINNLQKAIQ